MINQYTPLYVASATGHLPVVKALLDKEALINTLTDTLCTPLHVAAIGGHTSIVQTLLDRGAIIDMQTNNGYLKTSVIVE